MPILSLLNPKRIFPPKIENQSKSSLVGQLLPDALPNIDEKALKNGFKHLNYLVKWSQSISLTDKSFSMSEKFKSNNEFLSKSRKKSIKHALLNLSYMIQIITKILKHTINLKSELVFIGLNELWGGKEVEIAKTGRGNK